MRLTRPILATLALALAGTCGSPSSAADRAAGTKPSSGVLELLIPDDGKTAPKVNDYDSPDSDYCYRRMASSEHFALFWNKAYGDEPDKNPDRRQRFDRVRLLAEAERYYDFYVGTLKWLGPGESKAARYKMVIYVTGDRSGTAYGSARGPVGLFWTPASRIRAEPYGVVAHELGHSFQGVLRADGCWAFKSGGPIFEMTSQYMLWQVLPDWQTFEHYHLVSYLKQTHLAFLHQDNQYHSPYVLEYWSAKHGQPFVGKLWRESARGEDPVMTYKRLTGITQGQFDDEMFDAARKFVTWDLPRVEKAGAKYANQHTSALTPAGDGWFRVAPDRCPQNYGYNAIRLKVPPTADAKVTLEFEGLAKAEGFRSVHPERAGWRYGFLAVRDDGSRTYGPTCSGAAGKTTFEVPPRTKFLWFVVLGAPTQHWTHVVDKKPDNDEQWPYRVRLTDGELDPSDVQK